MKVINLTEGSTVYTSNVYLILGSHNALEDVNTLVDVGRDPVVMEKIERAATGVGKHRVEQVVLTHGHFDHAELLTPIRERFQPRVYAFSRSVKGVDHLLRDGDSVQMGDCSFEVIHAPCHSNDSLCLYCEQESVLFAGDTPLSIRSADGSYDASLEQLLATLCQRDIHTIYPGHGQPINDRVSDLLRISLSNVRKARCTLQRQQENTPGVLL